MMQSEAAPTSTTPSALVLPPSHDGELRELAEELGRLGSIGTVLSLEDGTVVSNYLSLDVIVARPRLLRRVAVAFIPHIDPAVERIAVSSPLGIAIGAALALELYIPMVVVGPRPDVRVRGNHRNGERVTLIEDQVLTGASARNAVDAMRDAGLNVTQVTALLHRSDRAETALDGADLIYRPLLAPALTR
jgi:orotate phosphoribosyltransferase